MSKGACYIKQQEIEETSLHRGHSDPLRIPKVLPENVFDTSDKLFIIGVTYMSRGIDNTIDYDVVEVDRLSDVIGPREGP